MLLLDRGDGMANALQTIRRHVAPNGRAVIDIWLPTPEDLALYDGRTVLDWVKNDVETQLSVSKTTAARYDSATRTAHVTSFFDAWSDGQPVTRTARTDKLSFISADEIERFARDAGLVVNNIGGDYDMGPFGTHSERVVMVLRPLSR